MNIMGKLAGLMPTPKVRTLVVRPRGSRRSFEAAETDRLLGGWLTSPIHINDALAQNLTTLMARSRNMARNSDYGKKFVGLVTGNVVGAQGIALQSKVKQPDRKGEKPKPDTMACLAIEKAWKTWSLPQHCDLKGQASLLEIQRQLMSIFARDGEFLAQKIIGKDGGQFGLKLNVLDPCRLDPSYNVQIRGGHIICLGIEFDQRQVPVAYHLKESNYSKWGYLAGNGHRYLKIPAQQMIHGFILEEAEQARGIPPMTASMVRTRNLSKYEKASLVNATVGASTMGFIQSTDADAEYKGDALDENSEPVIEVEPGVFKKLPPNTEMKSFDPTYPLGEFPEFVKTALHGIAAGFGVSYHNLTGDLSKVNYSSGRLGELRDKDLWQELQGWLTSKFNVPVFADWLPLALLKGQVLSPAGNPLPWEKTELFAPAEWRPRRWPSIDPLKDSKARQQDITALVRSRSDCIRELGHDPDEVWSEIQRENEILQQAGLLPKEKEKENATVDS